MEKQKGVKRIGIFTAEGEDVLSQILQIRMEKLMVEDKKDRNEELVTKLKPGADSQCLSCHVTFADREEQVEHYRLDWHRLNLKRRLKGLSPLSQDDFECQSADLSSISGSESDSENEIEEVEEEEDEIRSHSHGSPLLVFTTSNGVQHAIYRCLLTNSKDLRNTTEHDLRQSLRQLTLPGIWIVLMRSGGHFAGAVFRGSTVLTHKTFHRYTVRAKRGTIQSSRDTNHGGHKPKSAGASLRRYNETALEQEIADLMLSWKQYLHDAVAIFVRAPKHNRHAFTPGKNSPLSPDDPRIRSIPFITRRPTFKEVKDVNGKLGTIYSGVQCPIPQPKTQSHTVKTHTQTDTQSHIDTTRSYVETVTSLKNSSQNSILDSENDEIKETSMDIQKSTKRRKKKMTHTNEADPVVKQLHELTGKGDVDALVKFLEDSGCKSFCSDQSDEDKGTMNIVNINCLYEGNTALHLASVTGHVDILNVLLMYGADPTIKNTHDKVPYMISRDKVTRDSFRRFMNQYPDMYDYTVAKIPSPLSEEMELVRKEKKTEKKKAQRKAQKERKKEKAQEDALQRTELERQKMVQNLSDRERRALAAEKRMANQLPDIKDVTKYDTCCWCGSSLCGVVPFEKLHYKYCKIECVREHRKELQERKN